MSTAVEEKSINPNSNTDQENSKKSDRSQTGQNLTKQDRIVSPAVNVWENEKEAIFVFSMPGTDESTIDISLEKGLLTVEGRVTPNKRDSHKKEYNEWNVDVYRRKFNLGKLVNPDRAVANYKNGQLRLVLPKEEPLKKKIEIQSN